MAKLKKNFDFKNAEVNEEEGLIYEFGKGDDDLQVHSLENIIKELSSIGRGDISITTTTTLDPIED